MYVQSKWPGDYRTRTLPFVAERDRRTTYIDAPLYTIVLFSRCRCCSTVIFHIVSRATGNVLSDVISCVRCCVVPRFDIREILGGADWVLYRAGEFVRGWFEGNSAGE